MRAKSAKSLSGTPVTLYLTTENADKVVEKAVKLGATVIMPVSDMFWGDRCGRIIDPEGHVWMIGTHVAEPTRQEMTKATKEMMKAQTGGSAAS